MQDVQIVQSQEADMMCQLAQASLPSLTQLDLSQNNETGGVIARGVASAKSREHWRWCSHRHIPASED